MPQIFKISGYLVYFWTNENEPLEPIHFHITDGDIWDVRNSEMLRNS